MEIQDMTAALVALRKEPQTEAVKIAGDALAQAIQEIQRYHEALNTSLPLLLADYGFKFYNGTDQWLAALAQHPDLGITMNLYAEAQNRGILPKDEEESR